MPSPRIPNYLNSGTYFLTLTIKEWHYILDRYNRGEIRSDSLQYCREHKNLKVHAFVFMVNHIHIIITSPDVSGFVRDHKKHTSCKIMRSLQSREPQLAKQFIYENGSFSVWEKTNMPKIVEREKYFLQKQNYIHQNTVKKRLCRFT